jgi:polygalacturonase
MTMASAISRAVLSALVTLALAQAAEFRAGDYGTRGDGQTVDTAAIQKAIDAAARHGGTVVFRPGVYLSGSLFLKSRVHLRVDEGVVIRGVQDLAAYPVLWTRVAGIEMNWPSALINVREQSGVRISGKGTIDGDGRIWWNSYWRLRKEYDPKGLRWAADYDCMRPRLIQIYKSSDVRLEGLRLERSGLWTVHICFSRKVTVDGVTIRNNIGGRGPSTDGIDIDSSTNVLVEHCDIECNDDALCLKAGRDADGLRVNLPTRHVVIRDSTVRDAAAGVTFGSETSGGIRDVEVYRLKVLRPTPAGILFKSARTRGGTVQNIVIHDLDMEGVATAIRVNLNWNPSYSYATLPEGVKNIPAYWKVLTERVPPERGLPHLQDVRIYNIKAAGAERAILALGYPEAPLRNFRFRNLTIEAKTAGSIEDADDWVFTGTRITTADGSRVTLKNCRNVTGLGSE